MMVELDNERDDDDQNEEEDEQPAKQLQSTSYPKSIYFIFGNEMCERFSFYGLRTVLFLYVNEYLGFSDDNATAIFHAFVFSAYCFPILGAILSDVYLGKYRTILYLSIIYSVGSVILSFTAIPGVTGDPPGWWGMAIGLLLIAAGTGGIKPCVSSFGGDQFEKDQHDLLASFFAFFYFSINFGSFISELLTPILRRDVGYWCAFGVPAVLLLVSTVIFVGGKKHYKMVPVGENVLGSFVKVVKSGIREALRKDKIQVNHWLDRVEGKYGKARVDDVKSVVALFTIFLPLPCFWALFDQTSSRWIVQGRKMDMNVLGIEITPDQMPALNPFILILLIPLFERFIYPFCRSRNINLLPLNRMKVGMFFASASYAIAAVLELFIDEQKKISIVWQIFQYVTLSIGEVLVSISGLEFSYSQAPESMKSVVMALWLLAVALGNALVVVVASLSFFKSRVAEFVFFAVLMLIFMIIFVWLVRDYQYRSTPIDLSSVEDNDEEFMFGSAPGISLENLSSRVEHSSSDDERKLTIDS